MDLKLKGQHVLDTGASGGIGFATAAAYLAQGCFVSLHYNSEHKTLQPLLDKYPDHCVAVKADVRKEDEVAQCLTTAAKKFGLVTILIANHGMFPSEGARTMLFFSRLLRRWRDRRCQLGGHEPEAVAEHAGRQPYWHLLVCSRGQHLLLLDAHLLAQYLRGLRTLSAESLKTVNASIVIVGSTAGKVSLARDAQLGAE